MTKRSALIVERLGSANADRLSAIAGGTRLHVPLHVTTPASGGRDGFKRLALLVGEDLAILLVLHFADTRLYVPTGQPNRPVDAKAVSRLTKRGWSAARIARKLRCSDRAIHEARANVRQSKEPTP